MSSSPQNAKAKVSFGRLIRLPETGCFIGFVVVYIFFAFLGGAVFVGAPGWSSWLNIAAEVGIIALPVGLLMIAGEFDISVGSIVPAFSMTVAILSGHYDLPATVGIFGGLAVGVSIGFVNCFGDTDNNTFHCDHWRDVCGNGHYSWICCSA